MKANFEVIREKVEAGEYEISVHAFERMRQRGISLDDLENAIIQGDLLNKTHKPSHFPNVYFSDIPCSKARLFMRCVP